MSGIWIGEIELQIPPDRLPLHHPQRHALPLRLPRPQPQRQQQIGTKVSYRPRRHSKGDQHPQLQDLPTPSDAAPTILSTNDVAIGSPKIRFSAGLPSRIPSDSLKLPFDLHCSADGLSQEEQAVLKQHDFQRIMNSIYFLGYEPLSIGEAFNCPRVTFFHKHCDAITRLQVLIRSLHAELNGLMPMLYARGADFGEDLDVGRWKEQVLTRLLADVMPSLGRLVDRTGRQAANALNLHQAEVRLNVGGRSKSSGTPGSNA